MPRNSGVIRDRRRSTKYIHVGQVTVYPRGAYWHLYYRENGRARRVRVGPDRKVAEQRAAEVNAQLAHGLPSAFGFARVSVLELRRLWIEHHEMLPGSPAATVCRQHLMSRLGGCPSRRHNLLHISTLTVIM